MCLSNLGVKGHYSVYIGHIKGSKLSNNNINEVRHVGKYKNDSWS